MKLIQRRLDVAPCHSCCRHPRVVPTKILCITELHLPRTQYLLAFRATPQPQPPQWNKVWHGIYCQSCQHRGQHSWHNHGLSFWGSSWFCPLACFANISRLASLFSAASMLVYQLINFLHDIRRDHAFQLAHDQLLQASGNVWPEWYYLQVCPLCLQ